MIFVIVFASPCQKQSCGIVLSCRIMPRYSSTMVKSVLDTSKDEKTASSFQFCACCQTHRVPFQTNLASFVKIKPCRCFTTYWNCHFINHVFQPLPIAQKNKDLETLRKPFEKIDWQINYKNH